jgi:hypothetical protein
VCSIAPLTFSVFALRLTRRLPLSRRISLAPARGTAHQHAFSKRLPPLSWNCRDFLELALLLSLDAAGSIECDDARGFCRCEVI